MKKIILGLALILMIGLVWADRYTEALATVGTSQTIVTLDTLAYADTNEHAFTLDSGQAYFDLEYWSDYIIEIQVTYRGNPGNVNLLVSYASSGIALTAANAISQLDTAYWTTETIDLNTSGGTATEYYLLDGGTLNGKYIYFKYAYSGDPTNDPKIALHITRI